MAQQIADISDSQASFDAKKYAKRHSRIRIKATQGTGFTAHTYAERVNAARDAGLAVDHYCYLTTEAGVAQADHFLEVVHHAAPGDRLMADCETAGLTAPVVDAFVDRCHANAPTVKGLIYGGPYFLRDNHIVSTHGWGLVLADYTTASKPIFWPPGYTNVDLEWQWTSSAHTAGISGGSDLSRIVRSGPVPRDLSRRQHRRTIKFTHSMDHRTHPLTPKALKTVDAAVTAASHAKGIR